MKSYYVNRALFVSAMAMSLLLMADKKNMTDGTSCDLPMPQTIFLDRPQGLDSAALFNPFYYECCDEHNITWYWLAGYRFRGTWDSQLLTPCMFACSSDQLVFAGSHAPHLTEDELVGDYIGMAPNKRTTISLKPVINDHIFDFFSRFDLCNISDWFGNVWVALGTSLAYSAWDLKHSIVTKTTDNGFSYFLPCYMNEEGASAASTIQQALSGNFTFGDMRTPWRFGKWTFKKQTKTRLANIDFFIGDDIIRQPKFHVGAFVKASAPTGNRPDPEFVFNPTVGNGHHWELGGGLDAHWTFYDYDDECFQLYVTGSITHLFNDTQWRSFDFKSYCGDNDRYQGRLSRYVLLKEFDDNLVYKDNLINAIDFTTRQVKSSFAMQGDATFRLQWRNNNWAVGLGYNIFGRSAETLTGPFEKLESIKGRNFGIKGTSGTCARGVTYIFNPKTQQMDPELTSEMARLNATQSRTRMYNAAVDGVNIQEQSLVDHAQFINEPKTNTEFINWDSPFPPKNPSIDDAQDSRKILSDKTFLPDPILVTDDDLASNGVPTFISHKAFLSLDYQWDTCCHCWQPYLGVGAEIEFYQRQGCARLCQPGEECLSCEPRFWSIWIQGGMNF